MKWIFFILTVVASIPAVWQVMTPGYFPMHDNTQVVRVYEMHKALLQGQFPVRWVPDLGYGYGYPIFNFYNPLPYYVGAGIMLFGFDALEATKLMMVFGIVLSSVSIFVLAQTILKRSDLIRSDLLWLTALLASILYVYAPYHAVQIYVRGAVAEYWAYAILPLVFWALLSKKIILGGIALAALILSHNLTAFLTVPFLTLLMVIELLQSFKRLKWKRSLLTINPASPAGRHYPLSIMVALGLSAFFWLPALVEAPKTRLSEMVFQEFDLPSKHLVSLSQLWNSSWGYGGSSAGLDDGMSFQVGKIHLIGSVAAIAILLYCYIAKKRLASYQNNKITIFLVSGFLLSIFLMLPASSPIWNVHPIFSYIQFPWRLLTFASFFSSILTAITVSIIVRFIELKIRNDEPRKKIQFISILVLLMVPSALILWPSSLSFFRPQFKFPTFAAELTSRERIVWEVSKRSDEYLPLGFIRPKSLEEALRGGSLYNQRLVDEMKKPTVARRSGNLISFLSLLLLILLIWKGRTLRQDPTF